MILDTIILENFGAYGGRQLADLTPEDGKPIILFGGMNGGGKTTLLDAVQLAFYGPKARISNRGRLGYKDYLRESIHRGSDPGEGANITLRFRRIIEGQTRNFELQRSWRQGVKGIEETVRVLRDGQLDDIFTDHWDETIESYLPSGIAHLFFFDGEQIKELAEGRHAAEILGTAVHSLLGLDLVDRLEVDLKLFERRKRTAGLDPETSRKLSQAQSEVSEIDRELEKAAMEEGTLVNEAGRLGKELRVKEDQFKKEGGELFLQRKQLESELAALKAKKAATEAQFRELAAGPLPLLLVEDLLGEVETLARHESEVRRARLVLGELEARDNAVLHELKTLNIRKGSIQAIDQFLHGDRQLRSALASEELILDAEDSLAPHLAHLRATVLPTAEQQARDCTAKLASLGEKIARLEGELDRVPTEDRIAEGLRELEVARSAHHAKLAELEAVRVRKDALQKHLVVAEGRLEKVGEYDLTTRFAEDDRQRTLKHSRRVRETLGAFRARIVQRHASRIESLMLESFRKLLHKQDLVSSLTINPSTFDAALTGRDTMPLPFDRLSAGEKQLLATSLLWGLARASGRPVPTIIDTPLGRLDSSHRRHLIERYFPFASHQVLLLSTDEEIVGPYYEALKPFVTRTYLLTHDEAHGETSFTSGYFS
ncbi:MAG: DNA sulfur modification protein DndD [Thermodesulfobacteriota bacterium]